MRNPAQTGSGCIRLAQNEQYEELDISKNSGKPTGTCFIQKIYAPSSSLLQGKHQPFRKWLYPFQ
jgi:hypothetical protein